MPVESLKLKMKSMPRVRAEMGEYVVIETTHNGETLHEAICYVDGLEYNVSSGKAAKVRLSVFDPNSPQLTTCYDLKPTNNE